MVLTRNTAKNSLLDWLLFGLVAIFLFIFSPKQGGFWWSDASRHAMNGAFFYEFLTDLPLANPIEYAVDFYLRYPALSIGFYPPFFAVAESWVFFLTGPSHFSAQLTVAIFYFLAMAGAYRLSSQWIPRIHAVGFVLLFAGAQQITFWGRQVMLEIPAYAFLIWSVHYFFRYLTTEKNTFLELSVLLFALGCYTKLNLVFMTPVFIVFLLINAKASALKNWRFWLALLSGGLLLSPLAYMTLHFGQTNIGAVVGGQATGELDRTSVENWLYYLKHIPMQFGALNLVFLIGSLAALAGANLGEKTDRRLLWFFGAWFVWGYLCFSLIALKEPRHGIFLIFPLLFIAMLIVSRTPARGGLSYGLLGFAILNLLGTVIFFPAPYVRNHAAAADYVASELPRGYRAMIHGYRDGNFIFNLWRHGHRRDLAVLRSDKFLLDMAVKRSMGVEEKELTAPRMLEMLNDYGVYFVVCEEGFWDDLEIMERFETLLKNRFQKVYQVLLDTNVSGIEGKLTIYRNPDVGLGPFKDIQYDLPIIGAKIRKGQLKTQ